MIAIYVDADGCPVKQEVYRVARRYELSVRLVANAPFRIPPDDAFEFIKVSGELDAADDWIAEHIEEADVCVTADLPLASRCIARGAAAISPRGRIFTEESIGNLLASREVGQHLREMGLPTRGPAPLTKSDRSEFLQKLDETIQSIRRKARR